MEAVEKMPENGGGEVGGGGSVGGGGGDNNNTTTTTVECSSDDKARAAVAQKKLLNKSGLATRGGPQTKKSRRNPRCRAGGPNGKQDDRRQRRHGSGRGPPGGPQNQQRKRRRGKKGHLIGAGPREKKSVNWQLPSEPEIPPYPLVPYNTNRFLMEYHMAEVPANEAAVGRDEFLTNEFSTVYETTKCERLESLSKQQLIQEYLQLETCYEELKQSTKSQENIGGASGEGNAGDGGGGSSGHHHNHHHHRGSHYHSARIAKWEAGWRAMKDQLRRLSAANHGELDCCDLI